MSRENHTNDVKPTILVEPTADSDGKHIALSDFPDLENAKTRKLLENVNANLSTLVSLNRDILMTLKELM